MRSVSEIYFLLASAASVFLFIYSIVMFKKYQDYKATHWSIFHSLNIISIIAAIASSYIYSSVIVNNQIDSLSLGLGGMFIAAITVVFFVVLGIVGKIIQVIQKRKAISLGIIKNSNLKIVSKAAIIILSSFIISVVLSGVLLTTRDTGISTIIEKNSTQYLNEKYGEQDFVYKGCEADYVTYGILSQSFTGYLATFKSEQYDTEFTVTTDEKGNVEKDCFIQNYFKEELNSYRNKEEFEELAKKTNEAVKLIENKINEDGKIVEFDEVGGYELDGNDVFTEGMPNDYGKVPTKEEMFTILENYYMANSLKFNFLEDNLDEKTIESYCDKIYDILKESLVNDEFVSRFYYKISVEDNKWESGFIADIGNKKYFEIDPKFSPYSVYNVKREISRQDD